MFSAGGRVLAVVAQGSDREEARTWAYAGMEQIQFEGMHYRLDIAGESRIAAATKS